MTTPHELTYHLPIETPNGTISNTAHVWHILRASYEGNLEAVQLAAKGNPALLYAQFNYTPPIHFAVREGHTALVRFLLEHGAFDPNYRTYPFLDDLVTVAQDRAHDTIARLLQEYIDHPPECMFKGDCGKIYFSRTAVAQQLEALADKGDLPGVERFLQEQPALVHDTTYYWGEGILCMPAKAANIPMMQLLLRYGAQFPAVSKWPQYYYFEKYEGAAFILENGMSANHRTWQEVTILHDMAQKGKLQMVELLLRHGADINAIDDEYQSTPLGLAARWGQARMVEFLLRQGADPFAAGAAWARPLEWATRKNHEAVRRLLTDLT